MRQYSTGTWGIGLIFAAGLAVAFHFLSNMNEDFRLFIDEGLGTHLRTSQLFVAYNFLFSFILTFRSSQAYARWWEGSTLLLQARGEWFNSYSSLIAFCTTDMDKWREVKSFQKILATLMSMLFCSALSSVAQDDIEFAVRQHVELEEESAQLLRECPDKCEVMVHWIQRLIVANMQSGVLPIPPPVMSRVFQELSRGMVNINNARKISDFLLPYPYAQLTGAMLLLNTVLTPMVVGVFLKDWVSSALVSSLSIFAFACINCIAAEIECPFGADENDLPMRAMQDVFNRSLSALLDHRTQRVPANQELLTATFDDMDMEGTISYHLRRIGSVMGPQPRRRYRTSTGDAAQLQCRSHHGIRISSRSNESTTSDGIGRDSDLLAAAGDADVFVRGTSAWSENPAIGTPIESRSHSKHREGPSPTTISENHGNAGGSKLDMGRHECSTGELNIDMAALTTGFTANPSPPNMRDGKRVDGSCSSAMALVEPEARSRRCLQPEPPQPTIGPSPDAAPASAAWGSTGESPAMNFDYPQEAEVFVAPAVDNASDPECNPPRPTPAGEIITNGHVSLRLTKQGPPMVGTPHGQVALADLSSNALCMNLISTEGVGSVHARVAI